MIRHAPSIYNHNVFKNLKNAKGRHSRDGVNSVKYKVIKKILYTGFTYFLIDIGQIDDG